MNTWLIDIALFKSLAPGAPKGATLRSWIETREDSLFLSAASLVELEAVIDIVRGRDTKRAEGLQAWLDGLVTTFSDRIHPIGHPRRSSGGQTLALSPDRPRPPSLPRRGSSCDGAGPWPRPTD